LGQLKTIGALMEGVGRCEMKRVDGDRLGEQTVRAGADQPLLGKQ
jgi:hypothetical protein